MRLTNILVKILITLLSITAVLTLLIFFAARSFVLPDESKIGNVKDEALLAGRLRDSFPAAAEPYFINMDKGLLRSDNAEGQNILQNLAQSIGLTEAEVREHAIKGQNTWLVWTGGNDRFWDQLASTYSFGSFDLLKVLSSSPSQAYGRDNRWSYLGLVNEPCFVKASKPDEYGLWLDERIIDPAQGCPEDPFANENKYPGVKIGARGETVPVGSFYGKPSGIVGLRLFPNPNFDAKAAKYWDGERYYTDPDYYQDKDLVRPYRVGMSCGFCHVGPSPVKPPADPENPKWENLASNPGAQYFWVNRIFVWDTEPRDPAKPGVPAKQEHNIVYQLFHTNPPGALDTSLISTDYMNNPRTMNAVYSVGSRLEPTQRWGSEKLANGELDNAQFNDYPQTKALGGFWNPRTGETKTARVLKDGADAVGILGALNRVYLNIGLFSEEWLEHFFPVVGGQKISPIKIADAQKNSSYWNATEDQTADMALFFLATATPDDLADAPGGQQYLTETEAQLTRGKIVFAENCAACHSSKIPDAPAESGIDTGECHGGGNGKNYRVCWDRYWQWVQTEDFKRKMTAIVLNTRRADHCPSNKDPFLCDNFLSTERRIPVDLLETNACSPLATNALAGDIWDNFSSQSYKELPAVKELTVHHPVSGGASPFQPLGNGRGYTRPASLISLWSSAPYLLNNAVGHMDYYENDIPYSTNNDNYQTKAYDNAANYTDKSAPYNKAYGDTYGGLDPYSPGVANRMAVFNDSIKKMLNPALRRKDSHTKVAVPGYMYRTSAASCAVVPHGYLPDFVQPFTGIGHWLAPWAINEKGDLAVGPFPEDLPLNLVINTKLIPDNDEAMGVGHLMKLLKLGLEFTQVLKELGGTCSVEELRDNGIREKAKQTFYNSKLVEQLLINSKCPDYIVNKGHYFGSDLSQDDKTALIAYLKTF